MCLCFELQTLRLQETAGCFERMKRRALNDRLMLAEKGFLDADGLRGRNWFKHLVSVFLYLENVLLEFISVSTVI